MALELVKDRFDQYAEFHSLCSTSPVGKAILAMLRNKQPLLAMGALASNLGIPANDLLGDWVSKEGEFGVILSGYALGQTPNVVRSGLPEHRYRMEEQLRNLDQTVRQAERDLSELKGTATSMIEESSGILAKAKTDWVTFVVTARDEWETLRKAFESQLRLEAPATYWRERAEATSTAARRWLFAFSVTALTLIGVVVLVGPGFLQDVSASSGSGPFTTLALPFHPDAHRALGAEARRPTIRHERGAQR